jgi:hypothetical protein
MLFSKKHKEKRDGRQGLKKPVFYITRILFSAGTGNIFYYQFPWLYRNSYVD